LATQQKPWDRWPESERQAIFEDYKLRKIAIRNLARKYHRGHESISGWLRAKGIVPLCGLGPSQKPKQGKAKPNPKARGHLSRRIISPTMHEFVRSLVAGRQVLNRNPMTRGEGL
jgi:hypothetical protein